MKRSILLLSIPLFTLFHSCAVQEEVAAPVVAKEIVNMNARERALAAQVIEAINKHRAPFNKREIVVKSRQLESQATQHSEAMKQKGVVELSLDNEMKRLSSSSVVDFYIGGYGANSQLGERLVTQWKNTPGRQNDLLKDNSNTYGVGVRVNSKGICFVTCLISSKDVYGDGYLVNLPKPIEAITPAVAE